MSSATVCSTTTRGSWNTASPLRHPGDQLEARQPQRSGAAQAAAARAVDQPGAGDHLGQHHRDGLQRLDLDVLVAARLGMLDGEHADRAFEPDDRERRRSCGSAPRRSRACRAKAGMLGGLGEVEDAPLGGDRADQALAHAQPGDVHRFLAQAVGREQLEVIVAQQVDRADLAPHCCRRSRSTTWSSLDWAEPRLAMIACRPVRISRAEAAAESGMGAAIRWSRAAPRTTFHVDDIRPGPTLRRMRLTPRRPQPADPLARMAPEVGVSELTRNWRTLYERSPRRAVRWRCTAL